MENIKNDYRKCKKRFLTRNVLIIQILVVGAIVLCMFLAFMQNKASELRQKDNSEKILDEVTETLKENDKSVNAVMDEFNTLNQTTMNSLSQYMIMIDILDPIIDEAHRDENIPKVCARISDMCEELNVDNIFLINESGDVVLGSQTDYLGKNLSLLIDSDGLKNLTSYKVESGKVIVNGTVSYEAEKPVYNPIEISDGESRYYFYSSYFGETVTDSYFLVTAFPSDGVDVSLKGIKDISSVLKGVTVGTSGFVFAVNSETKTFEYFNDGDVDLSGENYKSYGLKDTAAKDKYSGYQKIDGTSYYCVTKSFSSDTYGEFTIIAAVVSRDALLSKNITSVSVACIAFILVACIVAGYGLILKKDIANHTILLEEKKAEDIRAEISESGRSLTNEEIEERTKIYVDEMIENGTDKQFKRRTLGLRGKNGKQSYISTYILFKIIPISIIGLFVIFIVSFFSQTLLGLDDATSTSEAGLNDVVVILDNNKKTTDQIDDYISEQFLGKAKLISYMLSETPDKLYTYDPESNNTHLMTEYDENGKKVAVLDENGMNKYSMSYSPALKILCEDNGIQTIYVFDDEGRVRATNTDVWYFKLSSQKEDQSYPFNSIIDEKTDYYIQDVTSEEVSGNQMRYIGYAYYYYTYLSDDGTSTLYARKSDYDNYLQDSSTWTHTNKIVKHRGMVQISIDHAKLESLNAVTELSYVLGNTHVYGDASFFVAFDTTDDHRIIYSPYETSIGKRAEDVGVSKSVFKLNGVYNGFQTVNGVKYYQSYMLVGDYYIATAIPTSSIYAARNAISSYTLLFSAIFILVAAVIYSLSSDKADNDYITILKKKGTPEPNEKSSFLLLMPSGKTKRTRSAASRYTKIAWNKKTAEEKLKSILLGYSTVAAIAIIAIMIFVVRNKDSSSIFSYILSGEWERGFNIFAITETIMIMIMIITITKLAQVCVRSFCGALGARVETTGDLIVSVLKYGGIMGGFFYCLYLFGFNTASLLTSAGILSIVIGLGAQSLISDIIAGIFIVFEGEFQVGDIVTIGDFRGQVLEIGLRTTKIEDVAKNIKIFNNSSISGVLNMTKEASFASVDVSLEYGESLERVEAILKTELPKIKKRLPSIIDGPFYKGVVELGESAVNIKIIAQCEEKDRIQLSRDLNREMFLMFKRNNINIPFPQLTLSYLKSDENVVPTKNDKIIAKEFVDEQRVESEGKETSDKG